MSFFIFTVFFVETFYFSITLKSICDCPLDHFYNRCFKIFAKQFQHMCYLAIGVCLSHENSYFPDSSYAK